MKTLIYKLLFVSIFILLYGCADYTFNELNPIRLLCVGKFDPQSNSCIIETDFPNATSNSEKSEIVKEPSDN